MAYILYEVKNKIYIIKILYKRDSLEQIITQQMKNTKPYKSQNNFLNMFLQ